MPQVGNQSRFAGREPAFIPVALDPPGSSEANHTSPIRLKIPFPTLLGYESANQFLLTRRAPVVRGTNENEGAVGEEVTGDLVRRSTS